MMASNAQLVSERRDTRAFNRTTAEAGRGRAADDGACGAEAIDRYPMRTRMLIILGGAAISWAAVIGLAMVLLG